MTVSMYKNDIWNTSYVDEYILRVNKSTFQLKHLKPVHISNSRI